MKHYIDITLLPSDDIGIHFLWSRVMMQVHLALVEIQDDTKQVPVATSFPEYREYINNKPGFLGQKLRLMALDRADLVRLDINKWLSRLSDYVHVKEIALVPEADSYESFSRENTKGSLEKYIRRRMKRHDETYEQALSNYDGYEQNDVKSRVPFIKLKSLTSGNVFCLNIDRKCVADKTDELPTHQLFNTYGLNRTAILPKF
ncbi:hypothetical protein KUL118_23840 [Tenacibaculum sp. KUL118]|nr:hypothetical protein KUL118_23840 [Tenacibaculum sp. KUL118]